MAGKWAVYSAEMKAAWMVALWAVHWAGPMAAHLVGRLVVARAAQRADKSVVRRAELTGERKAAPWAASMVAHLVATTAASKAELSVANWAVSSAVVRVA